MAGPALSHVASARAGVKEGQSPPKSRQVPPGAVAVAQAQLRRPLPSWQRRRPGTRGSALRDPGTCPLFHPVPRRLQFHTGLLPDERAGRGPSDRRRPVAAASARSFAAAGDASALAGLQHQRCLGACAGVRAQSRLTGGEPIPPPCSMAVSCVWSRRTLRAGCPGDQRRVTCRAGRALGKQRHHGPWRADA